MFKNYLKTAFRTFLGHKLYSIINLSGLALGMACFLLISLWCLDELSFDNFHRNNNRLYRINTISDEGRTIVNSSLRLGGEMKEKYGEIEAYTNFIPWARSLMKYGDKSFDEQGIYLVDPDFFKMFSFKFLHGTSEDALADLYSITITRETAVRYFGSENPVGKSIYSRAYDREFMVRAVIENIPSNSTFQFNIAGHINLMPERRRQSWEFSGQTFLMLREGISGDLANLHFKDFYIENVNAETEYYPQLQSVSDIHLYGDGNSGSIKQVAIFASIAVFVLFIAFINFMNLSTARSAQRITEVGIRKVTGAYRHQLIYQFIGESLLLAFIAFLISILLAEITLPYFNSFTGKELNLFGDNIFLTIFGMAGFVLLSGLIAGSYPALYLSSFSPVRIFKQKGSPQSGAALLRKLLAICQFTFSLALLICTMVVSSQLNYIQERDLGLNRQLVLSMPNNEALNKKFDSYKHELLLNPKIEFVSSSATQPVNVGQNIGVNWEGHMDEEEISMEYSMVDYDFFKTFNMQIVKGRVFNNKISTDYKNAVVINEKAAEMMNLADPVGKQLYFGHPAFPEEKRDVTVIGVVKDFHFKSMHTPIGPFLFRMYRPWHSFIFVKILPGNIEQTISYIEQTSKRFSPDYPFRFEFLDDSFNKMYNAEMRLGTIFSIFAVIAIIISCLGLFGLASFMAERMMKEIGIRKVLGASSINIVIMLSREFLKWVFIANVIALPAAFYFMSTWLQNFVYRIEIDWTIFVTASLIVFLIAQTTVSIQAIKAAFKNPVASLKYE